MTTPVEETAAAVAKKQQELADAQAAHEAATAADAGPRKPGAIITDLLHGLVMHTGNHPDLARLLKELRSAEIGDEPTPAPEEQPLKS